MQSQNSEAVLDAVIVGCGRIGGGLPETWSVEGIPSHAAAYHRHPDFHLAACVDPDTVRREGFMQQWGVAAGFATLAELAGSGLSFDVASLCTPTGLHEDGLRELLRTHARAVWCEKPLTADYRRSQELADAYRGAGKLLAVNHLRRWQPAMRKLADELAAGEHGAIRSITGFYNRGIRNNGSHMIDLIHMLSGRSRPIAARIARTDLDPGDPTVDALLEGKGGFPVHLVSSDGRDFAYFELEIVTAKGVIRVEQGGREIRRRPVSDDPDSPGYRLPGGGSFEGTETGDVFLRAAQNLYGAVVNGETLASSAASAIDAEQICDILLEMAGAA
ncbi:MAG: Gfo/Idh/MocA family oxidoreductase [Pseudomonadota bacterium]|nr:Gfo/Idh/MocA family oxidoreductase [Pseudomonadota bacterium]